MSPRTVLITGGTRGIGHALVEHFARLGLQVITTASSEEGAQSLRSLLSDKELSAVKVLPLDLGCQQSIDGFVSALLEINPTLDILINNAGITQDQISLRLKREHWDRVIDVNLTGTFFLTKAILRCMLKKRFGRIIFLSSIVASIGNPGQANYCASKAGLLGMMRSLSLEFAAKDITVNTISPGFIETDMTKALTDEQRQVMIEKIPCRKIGCPKDICYAAEFLASEKAHYITGQNLHVNGGLFFSP